MTKNPFVASAICPWHGQMVYRANAYEVPRYAL